MNKATLWKIALAVAAVAAILFVIAERTDNQQQPAQSAVPVVCKPYFAATALFCGGTGTLRRCRPKLRTSGRWLGIMGVGRTCLGVRLTSRWRRKPTALILWLSSPPLAARLCESRTGGYHRTT